jgi:acylphosphatase
MQIHLRVFGRVQGVGFRAWTVRQALDLHLTGFVRNRRDGSVEIMAEGEAEALTELFQRCHNGPTFARVDKVEAMAYPDAPMPALTDTFISCQTV